MAQHVLLPDTDIKLGANWISSWSGATTWSVLQSPRFAHFSTTAQGTGGGTNEMRVGFTTFTLAAGETVTSVVLYVRCITPTSPAKSLDFSILDNTGNRGGVTASGGHVLAAFPAATSSGSFTQANIDNLAASFYPGNENTAQVEVHACHIVVNTTGGPKFAYDPLASLRIRTNNDGAEFQDPANPTLSLTEGPQTGDEWETVPLPAVAGIPRTLWIIGDGVWADGAGVDRGGGDQVHGPLCHSIFGIQYGTDLTSPLTLIDWYPGRENEGGEGEYIRSFMPPVVVNGTTYYRWPQAGVVLDGTVLLVAGHLIQTRGGAIPVGTFLSRYTNITDTPDNWVEEVADWRGEVGHEIAPDYGSWGRAPAMGLSDPGDGYVYGSYAMAYSGPSHALDIWSVLRFDRTAAKTPGATVSPEYWDGQQWVPDRQFGLSNNRSWMRRRRPIGDDLAVIKRGDEPPGTFLFTFGSVFKRPDGNWMLTGMDFDFATFQATGNNVSHCWYAVKPTITGPFTPLINAGPNYAPIYGGSGFAYGGLQHWEQAWPGRGTNDVLISHLGNGPTSKVVANWPGMYRLTGT